jgi:hypothetical protein
MDLHELKRRVFYCQESGVFSRIDRGNGSGSKDSYGYLIIKIKGRQYKAHRLAWLYVYGQMPKGVIDHINGDRSDNRICNLRDVTQDQNNKSARRKPNRETGEVGVYIDKTKGLLKKFAAKIDGKTKRFYNKHEAACAVKKSKGVLCE